MRLLFLGDVVGRSGRNAVVERLPRLIEQHRLDFVVVNGENAAGGFGIAMSCDLVVASPRAAFEWAYAKTGLTGAESTTIRDSRSIATDQRGRVVAVSSSPLVSSRVSW